MNQSFHVAVNIAGRDMSKNVKIFDLFCETLHSQRSFNIAFDGTINTLVEVDTGCTVNDNVAGICNQLEVFW